MPNWDGEVCKKCGRDQRLVWSVNDDCWDSIVPSEFKNKVLCLECFFEFADDKKEHVYVGNFNILGVATNEEVYRPRFLETPLYALDLRSKRF